jgi:hypothetical protein
MGTEFARTSAWLGLVAFALVAATRLPDSGAVSASTPRPAAAPGPAPAVDPAAAPDPAAALHAPVPPAARAAYGHALRQTVVVHSARDRDGDGRRDRIPVTIARPAGRTAVPVVYLRATASGNGSDLARRYFVPRGYAVVSSTDDRAGGEVRQWLAGRRPATDRAGRPVPAGWASGQVVTVGCGGPAPCL